MFDRFQAVHLPCWTDPTKKITLGIHAPQVTTFTPAPRPGGPRGTVRGHDTRIGPSTESCGCPCTAFYCSDGYTCGIDSCVDACANSNRTLCWTGSPLPHA